MPAGRTELVGNGLSQNVCLDGRSLGLQRNLYQSRVGRCVLSKGYDTLNVCRLGGVGQPLVLHVVAVKHDGAAWLDASKNFCLGVSNLLQRTEVLKVDRLNGGHDRHMRAHELGERRDLTRVIHANFENGKLYTRRTARKR